MNNYEDILPMTMTKCPCGHPACNQYRLRGQRTQGFEEADAKFICDAVNHHSTLAMFFIDCMTPGEQMLMKRFEGPGDLRSASVGTHALFSRGLVADVRVGGFRYMMPTEFGWFIKGVLDVIDQRNSARVERPSE